MCTRMRTTSGPFTGSFRRNNSSKISRAVRIEFPTTMGSELAKPRSSSVLNFSQLMQFFCRDGRDDARHARCKPAVGKDADIRGFCFSIEGHLAIDGVHVAAEIAEMGLRLDRSSREKNVVCVCRCSD